MTEATQTELSPTPDQRRIATQQYERARQAINTGNYDYGIELLQSCCKLDPANLIYRKTLRATERTKYKNNMKGSFFSSVSAGPLKAKLKGAKQGKNYLKVLEHGEAILAKNPWDVGTQLDMSLAADALGMLDVAAWILEQARHRDPKDVTVNRALAELYERQGNFQNAIALWDLVARSAPSDHEAARKSKDLAATSTIQKGNYAEATNPAQLGMEQRPGSREFLVLQKEQAASAEDGELSVTDLAISRQIEPLRKKLATDPRNHIAYLQIANVYERAERWDDARKVLQDGLTATSQNFDLQMKMAEIEMETFRRNLQVIEKRLQTNPTDERLLSLRDRYVKEIQSRDVALIRQRADRFPTEVSHRIALALRLRENGQIDEAIQELQTARRDPRQRGRALLELGRCFVQRKNWALAKRNFNEALQNLPPGEEDQRKELLFQLAQIAAEDKDWETAVSLGTELADLDFGYQDIGKLLDVWQQHANETKVS